MGSQIVVIRHPWQESTGECSKQQKLYTLCQCSVPTIEEMRH